MAFTGNENHKISLEDAIKFTARYRERYGGDFLAKFFGKSTISKILNQQDCVGMRIYNAVDDEDRRCFVLVGATADEKDLYKGELAEVGLGCPPFCAPESPLVSSD